MLREEPFTSKICLRVRQQTLTAYGLEAALAFESAASFEKIRAHYSSLLNSVEKKAFTCAPNELKDVYVLGVYKEEKMIAGASFNVFHVNDIISILLDSIAVAKEHRRRKLGTVLINNIEEAVRSAVSDKASFRGEFNYIYMFAYQVEKTNPTAFFEYLGFKVGVPSGYRHWLTNELNPSYKLVLPKAKEADINLLNNFIYMQQKKHKQSANKDEEGKRKPSNATPQKKRDLKQQSKADSVVKSQVNSNAKSYVIDNTESEVYSSITKKSYGVVSTNGSLNKHCVLCDYQAVVGSNWYKHKRLHDNQVLREGVEYVICLGDSCPYADKHNKRKNTTVCQACKKEQYKEKMSKLNNKICKECEEMNINIQMTVQDKLDMAATANINIFVEQEEQNDIQMREWEQQQPAVIQICDAKPQICDAKPQICDAKPQICDAKPQICDAKPQICDAKPQICDASLDNKRTFSKIEDKEGSLIMESISQVKVPQSTHSETAVSTRVVVAHADKEIINSLMKIDEDTPMLQGAFQIQTYSHMFLQLTVLNYLRLQKCDTFIKCFKQALLHQQSSDNDSVAGLILASMVLPHNMWNDALQFINTVPIDCRTTALQTLSFVMPHVFNRDISTWFITNWKRTEQQQIDLFQALTEQNIQNVDRVLDLSIVVKITNVKQFISFVEFFINTDGAIFITSAIKEQGKQPQIDLSLLSELAFTISEAKYQSTIDKLEDNLINSQIHKWDKMIKDAYSTAYISDADSIQGQIDEFATRLGQINENLAIDLHLTSDMFDMVKLSAEDVYPNNKQFAVSQYSIGRLHEHQRQLWVVPSGQGKSRIATMTGFIGLESGMFSFVHFVFPNEHLMRRDQQDFEGFWMVCGREEQIKYQVGIVDKFQDNALVIIDEADQLIYEDPVLFKERLMSNACICYTATPDDQKGKGAESMLLQQMQIFKYEYTQQDLQFKDLQFDEYADGEKAAFIVNRCSQGPVLAYIDEQLCKQIIELYPAALIVVQNIDTSVLRNLEEQVDGKFRLLLVTELSMMRGVDYRCKDIALTLIVGKSFRTIRDALQGFNRVGRFGDKCHRIVFKDTDLVDKKEEQKFNASLIKFVTSMRQNPINLKPVTVKAIASQQKVQKVSNRKKKVEAKRKEEEKKDQTNIQTFFKQGIINDYINYQRCRQMTLKEQNNDQ